MSGTELQKYMCAAYLNKKKFSGLYPVTDNDLKMLASKNFHGRPLADQEIIDFIKQTCA